VRLINFKTLSIKNFLSIGTTPVVINFNPGINIITGTNLDKEDSKNGVGKSTIVDSLYFAFFGTTIRELNKDLIPNAYTKETCEVKLTFELDSNGVKTTYDIIRTLSPSKCFLYKDGEDITHSTLAKTNDHIQKLIRTTSKVFQNSVVMTINNTIPFMAQSKVDKRKFIESILSLEVFSDMLLKARDEHNELKREYEIIFTKNQEQQKSYDLNKHQLDLFEETKNNKIKNLDIKIQDNLVKIDEFTKQLVNIPKDAEKLFTQKEKNLDNELKQIQANYKSVYQKVAESKTNINHLQEQLKVIKKKGSICTTCNRPYTKEDIDHKEQNIKLINEKLEQHISLKEKNEKELLGVDKQQDSKEKEIKELNVKKNKLKEIVNNNKNLLTKISYIKETTQELLTEKEEINLLTNDTLEKAVKELENELVVSKQSLEKIDKDISILECVKFVVSEEGVKSYIVRKILQVLNSRLAYYLEQLQANCLCQFNEFFDESITDEKNQLMSYFNFSGGERKRIDLACLFAFLDIRRMQGDIHFSTIFYDELLDSSLDNKGVELVLDILKERSVKYKENSYIVTHRGTSITDRVDNTILLEKKNNITYLIS
jgi:DNA repair exonuclease SbcCD ATPase subunit